MPTPSRIAAAKALHSVFGSGNRVSEAWNAGLSSEDAGLAQAMLGACLRHWGRLRAYSKPLLQDPGRDLPLGSHVALALGLAQLAWMDGVAAHAAVNESVELAADKVLGFPPHKGLVNALLRGAAKDRGGLRKALDQLPARLDRSGFAEKTLRAALAPFEGEAALETLWAKLQKPPCPAFRVLRGDAPPGLEPDGELAGCWRLKQGASFPTSWLASGAGMVQDRSSQALMSFQWAEQPTRILDACAAPGGKTTALGMRFPGAQVTAVEMDLRRAIRLTQNLADRGVKADVVQADVVDFLANTTGTFDLIVLDAPCSASGTLQKHPELSWIAGNVDLKRLSTIQLRLMEASIARLDSGGLLIYAVCSWLSEEGERHGPWMASAHPEMRPEKIWPAGFGVETGATSNFRPHPLEWDGEGFQAFAWKKAR